LGNAFTTNLGFSLTILITNILDGMRSVSQRRWFYIMKKYLTRLRRNKAQWRIASSHSFARPVYTENENVQHVANSIVPIITAEEVWVLLYSMRSVDQEGCVWKGRLPWRTPHMFFTFFTTSNTKRYHIKIHFL